jgi:hypothetical protein
MSRKATIAAFAVLCLCSVVLFRHNRSGSLRTYAPDHVGIVFRGFITNSAGGVATSFRLRNNQARAISYMVGPPQIQLGGEWPHRLSSVGNPAQIVVRPHGEAEFLVPTPTESEPRRVPVAYVWAPSLYQRFTKWIAVHVLLRLRGGTRVEQVQAFTIFSPTVMR